MDTYYTIEEKYLQAVDELSFGETPKGLNLLNEIISNDPLYARAHYQLGIIYYYEIKDYQTAGYHFKTCMELEPSFPDNYTHYLDLLVFLNMEKQVATISIKALNTPGADAAGIYDLLGLFYEKNKQWTKALEAYQKAFMEVTENLEKTDIEQSLKRVRSKMQQTQAYTYHITE
ncbi:tetratricopeptide repeat protein [Mucilaginibacter lappiensis]|jgi:tetratricopeptide (TPR) repeat protein|uniref:tetratricopeptide repeat protein n=1 Tax=Mucilaginibacter lappiensis TaxID=354630 RepID=UPI003D1A937C